MPPKKLPKTMKITVITYEARGSYATEDVADEDKILEQILTELGVHDMILLTNTHHTLVGLEGYGLSIVGERAIPGTGGE